MAIPAHPDSRRSKGRISRGLLAVAGACVILLAAACGSASPGTDAASGTSGAPASSGDQSNAGSSAPVKLRIASAAKYAMPHLGVIGAEKLGLFAKHGIDAEHIDVEQFASAMASGSADFGTGAPIRLLGPMLKGSWDGVMIGSTAHSLMVAFAINNAVPASTLGDLKGSSFGVTAIGSLADTAVQILAAREGWSADDYEVSVLGSISSMTGSLTAGSIDAYAWPPLEPFTLEDAGSAKVIANDMSDTYPVPAVALFAANNLINQNPDVVRDACSALYEAHQAFIDDHSVLHDLLISDAGYTENAGLDRAIDAYVDKFATDSAISDAELQNLLDAARIGDDSLNDFTLDDVKAHYRSCDDL